MAKTSSGKEYRNSVRASVPISFHTVFCGSLRFAIVKEFLYLVNVWHHPRTAPVGRGSVVLGASNVIADVVGSAFCAIAVVVGAPIVIVFLLRLSPGIIPAVVLRLRCSQIATCPLCTTRQAKVNHMRMVVIWTGAFHRILAALVFLAISSVIIIDRPSFSFGNAHLRLRADISFVLVLCVDNIEFTTLHHRQTLYERIHFFALDFVGTAVQSFQCGVLRRHIERSQLIIIAVQPCQRGVLRHIERGQAVAGAAQPCQRGVFRHVKRSQLVVGALQVFQRGAS